MQFLKKLLQSRGRQVATHEPATGEQLRRNVGELGTDGLLQKKKQLIESLHALPPEHPGDLFYRLQSLSQNALELGMLDWRAGIDPRPRLTEIHSSFALALATRPDIMPTYRNAGFMAVIFDLMDWNWPFNSDPPGEEDREFSIVWMERWIIAGLADPSCWPGKKAAPPVKNQFVEKCLDDYWALLTDQIDAEEGIQRCIKNYNRRATHPTFKAVSSYLGGGAYNELFVDYTLAAILKRRGLTSDSVHDWIWD